MKNAMQVFRELPGTNCRECGEKTCLAFAGAVVTKRRRFADCPYVEELSSETDGASGIGDPSTIQEEDFVIQLQELKKRIVELDFEETAVRCGCTVSAGNLDVPVLGKRFRIKPDGSFDTDLHIIPWLVIPLAGYLFECAGKEVTGEYMSFREIEGEWERYPLFKARVEDVLCGLADRNAVFFGDLVHTFGGRQVVPQFASDVSVLLYPFPLVPVMLTYWRPEEGIPSSLKLFFDRSVNNNLGGNNAFTIGSGLARMLEKLARTHHL